MNFRISGHTTAQAVRLQPLASQTQVQSQTSPCGICGAKSGTFDLSLSIIFHQCSTLIHSLLLLSEGQVGTVCDPSDIRKCWIEKILHFSGSRSLLVAVTLWYCRQQLRLHRTTQHDIPEDSCLHLTIFCRDPRSSRRLTV
jgi:hypothetical protein